MIKYNKLTLKCILTSDLKILIFLGNKIIIYYYHFKLIVLKL